MRPPLTIITFMAGGNGYADKPAGEFRHVVGTNVIEVADRDSLGDPRWVSCGQRSPKTVEALLVAAIGKLALPWADAAIPYSDGSAMANPDVRVTARGLEINLGRLS